MPFFSIFLLHFFVLQTWSEGAFSSEGDAPDGGGFTEGGGEEGGDWMEGMGGDAGEEGGGVINTLKKLYTFFGGDD